MRERIQALIEGFWAAGEALLTLIGAGFEEY
jgi:hypothetical protein